MSSWTVIKSSCIECQGSVRAGLFLGILSQVRDCSRMAAQRPAHKWWTNTKTERDTCMPRGSESKASLFLSDTISPFKLPCNSILFNFDANGHCSRTICKEATLSRTGLCPKIETSKRAVKTWICITCYQLKNVQEPNTSTELKWCIFYVPTKCVVS